MKRLIYTLIAVIIAFQADAQKLNTYLKERAEKNLALLAKDITLKNRVTINHNGITLRDHTTQKVDVSAQWVEIGKVISILESSDYYQMLKMFEHKDGQTFANSTEYEVSHYAEFPTDLNGLYISLDPGHFGGNLESAKYEGRITKIAAGDLGTKSDVAFSEADLAYCTAVILKQKLEERGAVVMLTRPYGAGAMEEDYLTWITKEGFLKSANELLRVKDITQAYYDKLLLAHKGYKETGKLNYDLFNFYKFVDFKERARKINEFGPNITISIHFNAHDDNKFYGDRYLHPVDDNYNMMFVPGSFLHNELDKQDQKLDFLRLLLSPDMENSINLADLILDEHEKILGVPRRINLDTDGRMARNTIQTDKNGVYCRNLVLTRMVKGTLVYGESLLQDNVNEAVLLSKKDIVISDPTGGELKTSKRVKQVAEAYFNGIVRFLKSNEEKKAYYESLTSSAKH